MTRTRRLILFLSSLIALAVAPPALAAPAPAAPSAPAERVGVVVAIAVNVPHESAQRVAITLGAELQKALLVDVVAGTDVLRALPGGALPDGCLERRPCMIDLARKLDVQYLLFVSLVKVGDRTRLDPTLFRADGETLDERPSVSVLPSEADMAPVFASRATQLLPAAAPRPADQPPARPIVINQLMPTYETAPRRLTRTTAIAGGVGVALIAVGVGVGVSARNIESDLRDRGCAMFQCPEDDLDRLDRRALTADILVGAGLASTAVAAVLWYTSGGHKRPVLLDAPTPVTPVTIDVRSDRVAMTVGGRF